MPPHSAAVRRARTAPDPFALRAERLAACLAACTQPILWVRGMAGTGKSRWLAALAGALATTRRRGAGHAEAQAPLLLDDPQPRTLRAALASADVRRHGARAALVVASDAHGEVAEALLQERLYGRVAVLDDAELFLTRDECRRAGGAALYEETAGWPLLVDAALAGRAEQARALLPEFLRSRVLPSLEEDLAVALLGAALAAQDAALGSELRRVAPGHPLLQRAAGQVAIAGAWVAQALQAACARRMPLAPGISRRLVELFTRHGSAPQAIRALLALGLVDEALAVFERSGGVFFGFVHGFATLEDVLQAFGPDLESRRESLRLSRHFLLLKKGQTREALRRLDAHYPRLPIDLRRLQTSHRAYAILLRIDIAVDMDEVLSADVVTSWGRLDAFLPADDHLARGILFNTMTLGFLRTDRLVPAHQLAEEALAAFERARSPYLIHFMLVHLADIALRQGRLPAVAGHLRRAEAELRSSGLLHSSEQAILDAFTAKLAYEEGRLEDCPATVEPMLAALVGGDCWPGLIRTIMGYAPFVAFWRSGLRAAIEVAEQCALALGRRHGPTEDYALRLMRVHLYQMARRHADAAARLRELELDALAQRSAHLAIEQRLVGLRAQVMQHAALEATIDEARQIAGLPDLALRQRISLNLLQAYQRHRHADPGLARRHLLVALRAALAHNCVGVLLEDAEILDRLLPPLIDDAGADNASVTAFARRLMAQLRRLPGTGLGSRAAGVTRQEHRILLQLAEGGSNKEMARALALSESAVKFHLRNLFRKLKVTRRSALLERARARDLLIG